MEQNLELGEGTEPRVDIAKGVSLVARTPGFTISKRNSDKMALSKKGIYGLS